jgi:hypothetical protein
MPGLQSAVPAARQLRANRLGVILFFNRVPGRTSRTHLRTIYVVGRAARSSFVARHGTTFVPFVA